jgi:hypothetical protein
MIYSPPVASHKSLNELYSFVISLLQDPKRIQHITAMQIRRDLDFNGPSGALEING